MATLLEETAQAPLSPFELTEVWEAVPALEALNSFKEFDSAYAQEIFLKASSRDQATLLMALSAGERRLWLRLLDPDDAADVIQEVEPEQRHELLELLDHTNREQVNALLAYAEDVAGGLMNPHFVRVRPDMGVPEAIRYVRQQALDHAETIYYIYVLDFEQRLMGVMSLRELFTAPPHFIVRDVMHTNLVTVHEQRDQEELSRLFADNNLIAIPVVDSHNHMKGIVTIDDIVDVVEEEATEDIQKSGGMEALDAPYLTIPLMEMIQKRAGWLTILFVGEMFTATAMGHFQDQIAKAVVLALFVPLIISSGGNAGSQASTLVIRAMALGEIKLRDWWRVVRREFASGLMLGIILACVGLARILIWQYCFHNYGDHYGLLAITVAVSLVGVVMWGSLAGSILPMILRRIGFDPASASTPFVATLVDVTGLVIYFTVASIVMRGTTM